MRESMVSRLRCPQCRGGGSLAVSARQTDAREVRSGLLRCARCLYVAEIREGIVDLLHDPPAHVRREIDGLARFADRMRAEGWTAADIVELPYRLEGYWWNQRLMFDHVVATVPLQPGRAMLDLGANTCWAAAAFAKLGLDLTALDIAEHDMQGLATAEHQFKAKGVFFERVLGLMFDLPFADRTFDYVWASAVLHHNDARGLGRTFREIHRVLRPGGVLIVCNEPLRALLTPHLSPGKDVREYDGFEHVYVRNTYVRHARRAGLDVDVRGAGYHGMFRSGPFVTGEGATDLQIIRTAMAALGRRRPRVRSAVLALRSYVIGDTALHMVCTRPA